jgi:hypothetical protein
MSREVPDYFMLNERIRHQNDNRPAWLTTDNPEVIERMIQAELNELKLAEDEFFFHDMSDFHIVSEVGDVGYLFIRYRQLSDQIPDSVRDALFYAMNVANQCGFLMSDAVHLKYLRNAVKYSDSHLTAFDRLQEGVGRSKRQWDALGGDEAFFNHYMEEYGE